ncbi:hypothetical protein [Myceligenerans xiligouense]|nr:hypothetical protein [Myceligenerans xiligouense]
MTRTPTSDQVIVQLEGLAAQVRGLHDHAESVVQSVHDLRGQRFSDTGVVLLEVIDDLHAEVVRRLERAEYREAEFARKYPGIGEA